MGEFADYALDEVEDIEDMRLAHRLGQCGDDCPWCDGEDAAP